MMSKIKKGDIVFYNNEHEAWMTNLITEVLEMKSDGVAIIATRGHDAPVNTKYLIKLPADKAFRIYNMTRYTPEYDSPD